MPRRMLILVLAAFAVVSTLEAKAQSTAPPRIGVVYAGGPLYQEMLDGFKDGLHELGLEDGRNYILEVRNVQATCEPSRKPRAPSSIRTSD